MAVRLFEAINGDEGRITSQAPRPITGCWSLVFLVALPVHLHLVSGAGDLGGQMIKAMERRMGLDGERGTENGGSGNLIFC